jgi:hypothetical protein
VLKHSVTQGNQARLAGHPGETRADKHDGIDHVHCLVHPTMFARPALVTRVALQASLGLSLCGMGLASAQQPRLSAGALFESSRQVAVDQAQQAESGVAAQVSKALPAAAMPPAVGLRGLQGDGGQGRGATDSPFGTGYERRMERAAAAAGLSDGAPARPAAAGTAAGGGAGAGAHAGGQGSGRGRR